MARKRKAEVHKKGVFDVVSAVKSAARIHVGQPRPARVEQPVDAERVRGARHRKRLDAMEELEEMDERLREPDES